MPGSGPPASFTTVEALLSHYARHLPAAFVRAVIEAEKEIFVVRRECSLQETHIQFLRKCESALARTLAEAQMGRAAWEWNYAAASGDPRLSSPNRNAFLPNPPA